MPSETPGLDWLEFEPEAVVVQVTKKNEPPKLHPPYNPDDLQKIMDAAAKQFFDPTRPTTPPSPPELEPLPSSFPFRRRS